MKNNVRYTLVCLQALLFLFLNSACSRRGCADTDAENFEPKAKIDCECCYYSGKGLAWYKEPFYNYIKGNGITAVKYYANGVLCGEMTGYIPYYDLSAPTLATNGSDYSFYSEGEKNVLLVSLGSSKKKKLKVTAKDQAGNLLFEDSVEFIANKVKTIEIH